MLASTRTTRPQGTASSELVALQGSPSFHVINPERHIVGVIPPEYENMDFREAYITSAAHPYKCLNINGSPHNGKKIELWDCPLTDGLITKFLVPTSGRGPIRPVEAPDLCIESPEESNHLQLWSCQEVVQRRGAQVVDWVLNHESSSWLRCAHYDLPDKQDVEQVSAENLEVVMRHVATSGYAGFSVFGGTAWIKGVKQLSQDDLHYMGTKDPVIFYLHRPHDLTFHKALDMKHCMGVQGDGGHLHAFECGDNNGYELVEDIRFTLHYTGSTVLTTTPAPALELHPQVKVSMVLTSIDYLAFHRDRALVVGVIKIIKESVAEAAGHGISASDVSARLSPGTVHVSSVVRVPTGTSEADVRYQLETSRLRTTVAKRVAALPGIDRVSTGTVGSVEEDGFQWAHALKWLVIIVGSLMVCVCLAAGCALGGRRIRGKGGRT